MACRKILQLGFGTNIQEKTYEPQQFEVHLFINLGLLDDASVPKALLH
jgi:hypothetical protein